MKWQSQSANENVLLSEKKQPKPNTVSSIFTNKLAITVAMQTNKSMIYHLKEKEREKKRKQQRKLEN